MLKERPAAEAQYRRALAKDPDLGEAYNNLINLLFMDGRLDEARAGRQLILKYEKAR